MDPIRKVGSRRPHEDVQSNETEAALVQIPIRADEAATHEAQIDFVPPVPVSIPDTSATPSMPLKLLMADSSVFGVGSWTWNGVPSSVSGMGVGVPPDTADA